jgi:Protein of unknown function (DUF2842)
MGRWISLRGMRYNVPKDRGGASNLAGLGHPGANLGRSLEERQMRMANAGRKFAGTIGLLVLLIVYSLLVVGFAASALPAMGGWVAVAFYVVAGISWVPIAMALVSWMYRRDTPLPRP